jgi:L-ascorbate metabolism protein UlaG (beta-lactamase superfamily)
VTQAGIGRGVKITYYGHSAFRLSGAGVHVLIDPWLSNPLLQTPIGQVGKVDLILVTHGHGDHVGETVPLARKTGATVVAIHELAQIFTTKDLPTNQVIGMNKGGTLSAAGLKITMTQAVHSSTMAVSGKMVPAGEAGGFVVEFPNGFTIYHAGDTAVFKDMELIKELYQPELALLPIGSHYVMNPREAALACRLIRPKWVIPMHYQTFPVLTGTPEELIELLKDESQIKVIVLQPGETVD